MLDSEIRSNFADADRLAEAHGPGKKRVGSDVFGWRLGVGCSRSRFRGYAGWFGNIRNGVSMPVGINVLIGRKTSKLEVGIGVTPGIYSFRDSRRICGETEHGYFEGHEDFGPTSWRGSCALSIDVGYRLQRPNGFMLRVGLSPCLNINSDMVSPNLFSLLPYLSFGYTFN